MEFGIFHEFWSTRAGSQPEAFAQSFAEIAAAEEWGLDAVWLAEIHMNPTRALVTAPLIVASAIAARTGRIKIGTAVQILPLGHPLRLAEETATIDQISNGRLIFGIGRSAFPRAYNAYGISYEESQDRFAESLEIINWPGPSPPAPIGAATTASRISPWCRARCSCRTRRSASPPASPTPMSRSAGSAIRCSRRCAPARSPSSPATPGCIATPGRRPGIRASRRLICPARGSVSRCRARRATARRRPSQPPARILRPAAGTRFRAPRPAGSRCW